MSTTEFTLDDDNFDDAFFEEIDKLETLATSSSTQIQQHHNHHQILYSNPPQFFSAIDQIQTHSPPRELSQRNPSNFTRSCTTITTTNRSEVVSSQNNDEHHEIERLKKELSGVSKELLDLKQECFELKKQREKEQQLNFLHSNKKSRICNAKDYSRTEISPTYECVNSAAEQEKKSTGIQTEKIDESLNPSTSGSASTYRYHSELLSIWSPLRGHRSGRNFAAKLLAACASDFFDLFGCLGPDITSKMKSEWFTHAPMPKKFPDLRSAEVARVSQLYFLLMELADNLVHINTFLNAAIDLCSLENVQDLVVHRSLHILHISLVHVLSIERARPRRDNIKVEKCYPGSDAMHTLDPEVRKGGIRCDISGDEACHASFIPACEAAEDENLSLTCHVDWLHLFTSVCRLAIKLTDKQARVEAVTIMNIILMRTNPWSDREKFAGSLVFEAVSLLLRKEAGSFFRKEAVHLLYLLLNCPNILAAFCSSCKEADCPAQPLNDGGVLAGQKSHAVLEGLARCVFCSEYVAKDLNLRRNAIVVVSFLAFSGKCGLEIFLFYKLPRREATSTNFLGLVLQVLVSEIDAEALESCPVPESSKERMLVMREALILLNRLVSHPTYSAMILQVLTGCKDMISLVLDIATKLSKKSQRIQKFDSISRQMREYVVDLACLFKNRVFTFCNE